MYIGRFRRDPSHTIPLFLPLTIERVNFFLPFLSFHLMWLYALWTFRCVFGVSVSRTLYNFIKWYFVCVCVHFFFGCFLSLSSSTFLQSLAHGSQWLATIISFSFISFHLSSCLHLPFHSLLFAISTLFAVGSTRRSLYYMKTKQKTEPILYFTCTFFFCYSTVAVWSSCYAVVVGRASHLYRHCHHYHHRFSKRYSSISIYHYYTLNGLAGMYVRTYVA